MAKHREYVVTLKDMLDSSEFYDDLEKPGKGVGRGKVPERSVKCAKRRPCSRNTHYHLTDEEAGILREDERVIAIELTKQERGITPREHYNQTSSLWDKSDTITSDHKNWGLLRCYEGVDRSNWGVDGTTAESGTIKVTSSGVHVDVVIVDGGSFDSTHPEYAVNPDGTGGSRVVLYDWFQHDMEVLGTAQTESYSYGFLSNHSAHVAGTVAGNTQGWAREANIYSIGYGVESVFDYVRAFHNAKAVNPITGIKNPTIMNNSWGYNYDYGSITVDELHHQGNTYLTPDDATLRMYGYKTDSYLNGLPARSAAEDVDMVDCITSGVVSVGSAGNSDMKIDVSGGVDYNNYWIFDGSGDYYHRGSSPCAVEDNICVGSVGYWVDDYKSDFSSCGPRVDIFSPGHRIVSSVNDTAYAIDAVDPRNASYYIAKISGTSMASPQVCGILACALEQYPSMTQEEALEYLLNYAKSDQMTTTSGGYTDDEDLKGSPNRYVYYHKERFDEGMLYPKQNKDIRPSSGICYPRTKIRVTKPGD